MWIVWGHRGDPLPYPLAIIELDPFGLIRSDAFDLHVEYARASARTCTTTDKPPVGWAITLL